jgi:TolB protein
VNFEIYVMDANGANPTNITNSGSLTEFDPRWSPDGSLIAMMGGTDADPEIYVVGANGSNPTNVSMSPNADRNPSWSSDGTMIVFDSDSAEVLAVPSTGGNVTDLTNQAGDDFQPVWRPEP